MRKRKKALSWVYFSSKDKSIPTEPPDTREYVTITRAATIVGVSGQAIRLRLNKIKHWKPPVGALMVSIEDVKQDFGYEEE